MGQLSTTNIISEGLLMAGDSKLTTRAERWLNAWLRSQYAGFSWPFLLRFASGLALAKGANSFSIGNGDNGVTQAIRRIVDPVEVYDSSKTTNTTLRIASATEVTQTDKLLGVVQADASGVPTVVRLLASTSSWGKWTVQFNKWADRALLVQLAYYIQPTDVSGTDVPLYPNDRTMMKAVEVEALRFKKAENFQNELEVLASMVADDRLKFGEVPGQNDTFGLDPGVFR